MNEIKVIIDWLQKLYQTITYQLTGSNPNTIGADLESISSSSTQINASLNDIEAVVENTLGPNSSELVLKVNDIIIELDGIRTLFENDFLLPRGAKSFRVTAKAAVGQPTTIEYWSGSGFTGTLLTTATITYDLDGDVQNLSYS